MRKIIFLLSMAVALSLSALLAQAAEVYVQSVKAKIVSGPSFKAPVIAEVAKGKKLESTGREGGWVKVRYDSKNGYVFSLLVSNHRPLEKVGYIKSGDAEIKQGVRRRASSYTSAAAARGLASDDRRRLSKEESANYGALEEMESFTVTDAEVASFSQEKQP